MVKILRLIKDSKGVTALEYGLIAGLVAVVLVASVRTLGNNLNTALSNVATSV